MAFWVLIALSFLLTTKLATAIEIRGLKRRLREVRVEIGHLNTELVHAKSKQREVEQLESDLLERIKHVRSVVGDLEIRLISDCDREQRVVTLYA